MVSPYTIDTNIRALIQDHTTILVVACGGILLSAIAFLLIQYKLISHKSSEFEWVAHNRISALKQGIENSLNAAKTIRDLYLVVDDIAQGDFRVFARSLISRHHGIQALKWVPRVPYKKRLSFESLSETKQAKFQILEQTSDGRMVPADRRDTYYPIQYVEPQAENGDIVGFDIASNPAINLTLEMVRDKGRMAVSSRVELFEQADGQFEFLAYLPVYRKGAPSDTLVQRRENLRGFVVGVFRFSELADASIALLKPRGVDCMIQEGSSVEDQRLLGFYTSRLSRKNGSQRNPQSTWSDKIGPRITEVLQVANQNWSITCAPTVQFKSEITFQHDHWIVLGAGLSLTTFVTLFLIRKKKRLQERLKMERILREREQLFWQMTEAVDEVFWAISVDNNEFLYVSRGYEVLWGNSCENLYADPSAFSAAIHPSDRQRRLEALDRIRQGEASDMEYRVIHPNGSARWIRDSGFPVRNETGQIFRIVGVAEDITDRRLTDQALRESEGKLRTLFNYSPDIIMTVDRASRILMMNRSISELKAEHAIGQNSEVLVPPAFRSWYRRTLEAVLTSGEINHLRYSMPDATWWEVRICPINEDGQTTAAIVISTDVTENQNLQAQMLGNARLASIGVLAAGVAHEINNPNNAIHFNASLFARVWQDTIPILEEYLEENGDFSLGGLSFSEARNTLPRLLSGISENSVRIKRIVESLKHMSRQDAGELRADVNIQEVIQAAVMILHNEIQKHTAAFSVEIEERLPTVRGNPQQLEQVFINVILNALQSLPDRGCGVRIYADLDEENCFLLVSVQDDGVGISKEGFSRLTEPFFTTKTNSGGTGLGLSISSSIIKRHRGTMVFKSEHGKGTIVTIKLPLRSLA